MEPDFTPSHDDMIPKVEKQYKSIASAFATCRDLYRELVIKLAESSFPVASISQATVVEVRDGFSKLTVWGDQSGAALNTDFRASLDDTLRSDLELKSMVVDILQLLQDDLEHAFRESSDDDTDTESISSTGKPSIHDSNLEKSKSKVEELQIEHKTIRFQIVLNDICDHIRRLYQVSGIRRHSANNFSKLLKMAHELNALGDRKNTADVDRLISELTFRRQQWFCAGDCNLTFQYKESIRQHFHEKHPYLINAQLPGALMICEKEAEEEQTRECALRSNTYRMSQTIDHLASHLDDISLLMGGSSSVTTTIAHEPPSTSVISETEHLLLPVTAPPASIPSATLVPAIKLPTAQLGTVTQSTFHIPNTVGRASGSATGVPKPLVSVSGGSLGVPFIFRIDDLEENPCIELNTYGWWVPPTAPGSNRLRGGGISGRYRYNDGQEINSISTLMPGCTHFKTYSMYYNQGFWLSVSDASRSDMEANSWRQLSFDHDNETYASHLTSVGCSVTLRTQRPNQQWPRSLLPDIYHAPMGAWTDNASTKYGGLAGELPILLGLIAFSTSENNAAWAISNCYHDGQLQLHSYPNGRVPRRGMVVRVYCMPDSLINELQKLEEGEYGNYFN